MRGDNINMISEEAGVKHAKHENNLWTAAQQGCEWGFPEVSIFNSQLARFGKNSKGWQREEATPTPRGLSLA